MTSFNLENWTFPFRESLVNFLQVAEISNVHEKLFINRAFLAANYKCVVTLFFNSSGYPFLSFLPNSSGYSESVVMLLWIKKESNNKIHHCPPTTPLYPLCHLRAGVAPNVVLFVYETYLVIYALFLPCVASVCASCHCHFLCLLPGI